MEDLLQVIRQTFRQVSPELMGGILEKGLTVAGGAGIRGLESYLVEKLHCPILITTNVQNDILNGLLLAAKTRKNA
jgi:actin-like ATPase involved in cell morphogenesis